MYLSICCVRVCENVRQYVHAVHTLRRKLNMYYIFFVDILYTCIIYSHIRTHLSRKKSICVYNVF